MRIIDKIDNKYLGAGQARALRGWYQAWIKNVGQGLVPCLSAGQARALLDAIAENVTALCPAKRLFHR